MYKGVAITQDTAAIATVAGYTTEQFLQYKIVYLPPNLTEANILTMRDTILPTLKAAMAAGQLVVALSYGSGIGNEINVGPAGEDFIYSPTNSNAWVDNTHKLATGVDIEGVAVSTLGSWSNTVHVHFTDLGDAETRPGFKKVIQAASATNIALFEYRYEAGFVIVDGFTSKSGGWGNGNANFANNYAKYCMYAYDNYCVPLEVAPEGAWQSAPIPLTSIVQHVSNYVSWTENLPVGTAVVASAVVTDDLTPPVDADFSVVTNGGSIPGVLQDADLSAKYVWLKFNLSTSDVLKTPTVSNIKAYFESYDLQNRIELNIDPLIRFHNNEGPLTVAYDQNKGLLFAEGGYVESFSNQFTPTGLVPNPNPGQVDYVEVSPAMQAAFFQVTYRQAYNGTASIAEVNAASVKVTLTQVGVVNP